MELSPGKYLPSGIVLVECPDQVKVGSSHLSSISSICDYLQALSKNWSVKSFVSSLARILKDIKLTSNVSINQKENNSGPCTVRPLLFSIFFHWFDQEPNIMIAASFPLVMFYIDIQHNFMSMFLFIPTTFGAFIFVSKTVG
jgi:hypothetical protein